MIDFTQDSLSTLVDVSKFIIFMEIILLLLSGIYGGIVPMEGTSESLITPSGFRKDVLHLIRDELKVPIV
jgi:alpha-L-arabinofuranosidase